jgi:predicted MFS family arabinose efflux permease
MMSAFLVALCMWIQQLSEAVKRYPERKFIFEKTKLLSGFFIFIFVNGGTAHAYQYTVKVTQRFNYQIKDNVLAILI